MLGCGTPLPVADTLEYLIFKWIWNLNESSISNKAAIRNPVTTPGRGAERLKNAWIRLYWLFIWSVNNVCQKFIKVSPIYNFQESTCDLVSWTSLFEAGAADIKQNLSNEACVLILERCIVSCSQQGVNEESFLWRKKPKKPKTK